MKEVPKTMEIYTFCIQLLHDADEIVPVSYR